MAPKECFIDLKVSVDREAFAEALKDIEFIQRSQVKMMGVPARHAYSNFNPKEEKMGEERKNVEWCECTSAGEGKMFGATMCFKKGDMVPLALVDKMKMDSRLSFRSVGVVTKKEDDGIVGSVGEGVLELARKQGRELAQYHLALATLEEHCPQLLKKHNGDVSGVVWDLVKRDRDFQAVEADMHYDSKTGRCTVQSRIDGTMFSREQSRGVIRRVRKMRTPCDDQSGEDVCADAGGAKEWMK